MHAEAGMRQLFVNLLRALNDRPPDWQAEIEKRNSNKWPRKSAKSAKTLNSFSPGSAISVLFSSYSFSLGNH
jgi:hypothetical protein